MLYQLISSFIEQFRYITFRTSFSAVLSFILVCIFTPILIKTLKKKKFLERAEKKDSERLIQLHQNKASTPTMGGFVVIGAILISTILFARLDNIFVLYALLLILGLTILGYIDDMIKIKASRKSGITKSFKLLGQGLMGLAIGFGLWFYFKQYLPSATTLYIPLLKTTVELGWFYPIFVCVVITASSNSVNLTDGLDGLATGCLIMAGLAYLFIIYVVGRIDYTTYLNIPYIPGSGELTIFMGAFVGGCLGFLWFNGFPAEIFMGNVGAISLGGVLGLVAVVAKQEIALFLVGAIFVVNALSVILQVISYRIWGKRIFKIAPLHHHFQFNGISEPKITLRFWIVAAILAILTLATLKIEF
ncbi:MAG: phospho-N-acetylmuramoyl-pentapeptide-transferase [Planctomycetota bacterium]